MVAPNWPEWLNLDAIPQWDAVALSLGACPHTLRGNVPHEPRWPDSRFRDDFQRRRYALGMASLPHGGRWDGDGSPFVELRAFVAWAIRAGWDLPAELKELAALARGAEPSSSKPAVSNLPKLRYGDAARVLELCERIRRRGDSLTVRAIGRESKARGGATLTDPRIKAVLEANLLPDDMAAELRARLRGTTD